MLAMIWISGVSFLWEAIDAGYRGHTSISTGNRELDGHSRFIIPRPSLRARKIRCHLASRPSRSIFSPASRSTVCPFRSQSQEPLHKWPCPSFKITLETTDDHQGRPASPFRPSLSSIQLPPPFPFLSFPFCRLLPPRGTMHWYPRFSTLPAADYSLGILGSRL